jgi:RNA polymerase sigma factor (sigma-70 family)
MFDEQSAKARSDTLTRIFVSENRVLMRIAFRITRDADDASDAVQIGLLRACECEEPLTPEHMRGWLRVVVRRVSIDIVRARSKALCTNQLEMLNISVPLQEIEPHWMCYHFDDLDRALVSCPAPIRDVFRLWWNGLSYRAMAQRMSVPAATIATRVLRAKIRIRKYYRVSPR